MRQRRCSLRASPLLAIGPARPGPALRRGFLVAIPVGVALFLEFGLDSPTKGAIATGALLAGFAALDAPARVRAAWQAAVAPLVGLAAALGVLTGGSPALAIPAIAVVGAAAGYCFSVSLRLSIAGLSVALSLVIAQGLPLDASDALAGPAARRPPAACCSRSSRSWSGRRATAPRRGERRPGAPARRAPGCAPTSRCVSVNARHALRFGSALAAGVAAYWLLGMEDHGFWIPLTILFVLRPAAGRDLPPPGPARGRHRGRADRRLAALRVAAGRRDRARPGADHGDRLRLRPADRPVRALHRRRSPSTRSCSPTPSASRPWKRPASGRWRRRSAS